MTPYAQYVATLHMRWVVNEWRGGEKTMRTVTLEMLREAFANALFEKTHDSAVEVHRVLAQIEKQPERCAARERCLRACFEDAHLKLELELNFADE